MSVFASVLTDHDYRRPLGRIHVDSNLGGLRVVLSQGMTEAQVFSTFGNLGFEALKIEDGPDGKKLFREFLIREWSLDPRVRP